MDGDLAAVKQFCDQDRNMLDLRDSSGSTPLREAAWANQVDVVRFLLSRGADMTVADSFGLTPLHAAAETDSREVVTMLLDAGVPPDIVGKKAGAESIGSIFGPTPLQVAAMRGHVECAQLLIESGANAIGLLPNGETALHEACLATTASQYAGQETKRRRAMIETLLRAGAKTGTTDAAGDTPLHWAVLSADIDVVTLLLQHGADVNAKGCLDRTPLHQLAEGVAVEPSRANSLKIACLLLRNGAELGLRDCEGNTALAVARSSSARELEDLLIAAESQADVTGQQHRD